MNQIGHNGGPEFSDEIELIEIQKGSEIDICIRQFITNMSSHVEVVISFPTHIIVQENGEISFQINGDTIAHLEELEGKYRVIGMTTCVHPGDYTKNKAA